MTADDAIGAQRAAMRELPQVVLLDVRLPGGDGYQVMERLHGFPATAAIPVIIVTAEDEAIHKQRALAAGAVGFVASPFEAAEVLGAVRFVLGPLAPVPRTEADLGLASFDPSTKRLLVVDDDKDVRLALTLLFRSQGYQVSAAEDAISAVRMAVAEQPDLVILDIGLPGGEGFLVMQRFRGLPRLAAVPVVIITGRDGGQLEARAKQLGAVAFLQKPVDNRALLDTVRATLQSRA